VEAAVSDESCTLTFYKDNLTGSTGSLVHSGDDSFIASYHYQSPLAVSVSAVTLDELCQVDSPDFIKIDVEGAELKVLRGGEAVLSRSHPALMFECDQDQEAVHTIRLLVLRHGVPGGFRHHPSQHSCAAPAQTCRYHCRNRSSRSRLRGPMRTRSIGASPQPSAISASTSRTPINPCA
jgi:Methyltransferase FkbM domain